MFRWILKLFFCDSFGDLLLILGNVNFEIDSMYSLRDGFYLDFTVNNVVYNLTYALLQSIVSAQISLSSW